MSLLSTQTGPHSTVRNHQGGRHPAQPGKAKGKVFSLVKAFHRRQGRSNQKVKLLGNSRCEWNRHTVNRQEERQCESPSQHMSHR